MIEVKNLTKQYGDHLAVDDLSFTVDEGSVYGFLGPNGAGKSTTMNIMTGYLAPTEGEVIINGYNILDEPEKAKRTIGYLPEIPPLYPDMTVREYLTFAAELKKVPRKDRKAQVARVMDELNITDVADRLIKNLSKGYKQRVGFAQALVSNPETLILDEPTVGLDPKQIIEIRELIKELGKKHTVILSSHILAEVSEICDTVMIISNGRLVALDTPENLAAGQGQGTQIIISSPADAETLESVLTAFAGEGKVNISEGSDGLLSATIDYEGEGNPRKEIVTALAKAGCPYYSVDVKKASLEDIFLELTENEGDVDYSEADEDDSETDEEESVSSTAALDAEGDESRADNDDSDSDGDESETDDVSGVNKDDSETDDVSGVNKDDSETEDASGVNKDDSDKKDDVSGNSAEKAGEEV
ncbi:MAG: ABC transporter ATP-binding protein [Lachnospiraceae bacterium]|nr:ABC transporter ATP-binding protein [Lachnospiraceae bacterium]